MEGAVRKRLVLAAVMLLTVPALSAQTPTTPATPSGKWTVLLAKVANTPDRSFALELAVDAKNVVTGTYDGEAIVGEFAHGQLIFASAEVWKDRQAQLI